MSRVMDRVLVGLALAASLAFAGGCASDNSAGPPTGSIYYGGVPASGHEGAGDGAGGMAAPGPGACNGAAMVYTEENFQGASMPLPPGRYDVSHFQGTAVDNDTIHSVCVPPGWRVMLYADGGFSGQTLELTQSTNELQSRGFGQTASSIVVTAP